MNSQNPCGETLVTSTGEVLGPGATDFIQMLLNQFCRLVQARGIEPIVGRFEPELRLAVGMVHVYMHARLFAREEIETKPADAKDRRIHVVRINRKRAAQ